MFRLFLLENNRNACVNFKCNTLIVIGGNKNMFRGL